MGPFTTKSEATREFTEEFLREMKFQVGTKIRIHPRHVILKKRLQETFSAYEH